MSNFRKISIYPTHSNRSAIIIWDVASKLKEATFDIYKANDGGEEWVLLNTEPIAGATYRDDDFYVPNKEQIPMYRIVAMLSNGDEEISNDVALFPHVDRKAFGLAGSIIRQNYIQARHDGIPVLYYPKKRSGELNDSLDAVTGERLEYPCIEEDGEEDYGGTFAESYNRPFITFIRFVAPKVQIQNTIETGQVTTAERQTKFLSFPPVRTGDLVVDVTTDTRWLVGENVEHSTVKGIFPVAYKASLIPQASSDLCYNVPTPDNYYELLLNITKPHHAN